MMSSMQVWAECLYQPTLFVSAVDGSGLLQSGYMRHRAILTFQLNTQGIKPGVRATFSCLDLTPQSRGPSGSLPDG